MSTNSDDTILRLESSQITNGGNFQMSVSEEELIYEAQGWSEDVVKSRIETLVDCINGQLCREDKEANQTKVSCLKLLSSKLIKCVPHEELEDKVMFLFISSTKYLLERLFEEIFSECPVLSDGDICNNLEVILQVIDFTNCIVKVMSNVCYSDASIFSSLPRILPEILLTSLKYCKMAQSKFEEEKIINLHVPLNNLFRKTRELTTHYGQLLESLNLNCDIEEIVNLIVSNCEHLIEMVKILYTIDKRSIGITLKIYSKLIKEHGKILRTKLSVETALVVFSNQISDMLANIGNEVSLVVDVSKILTFCLRVLLTLCERFEGFLGGKVSNVLDVILQYKSLQLLLKSSANKVPKEVATVIESLAPGIYGLILNLACDDYFIQDCLMSDRMLESKSHSLIMVLAIVLDKLATFKEEVHVQWMKSETENILDRVFQLVGNCHDILSSDAKVTGVQHGGFPVTDIYFFHFVLVHMSGYVASMRQREFQMAENVLIRSLLSSNVWQSLLAQNIWALLARYSSPKLCLQHFEFLCDVYVKFSATGIGNSHLLINIENLVKTLFIFLSENHKNLWLKQNPPSTENLALWLIIPHNSMKKNYLLEVSDNLWNICHGILQESNSIMNFRNYEKLLHSLDLMIILKRNGIVVDREGSFGKIIKKLSKSVLSKKPEYSNSFYYVNIVSKLMCLTEEYISQNCSTQQLIEYLIDISILQRTLNMHPLMIYRISTVLARLASRHFPEDSKQASTFRMITRFYTGIFSSSEPISHYEGLRSFWTLAHLTRHIEIISECVKGNSETQHKLQNFLNNIPRQCSNSINDEEFFQLQQEFKSLHRWMAIEETDVIRKSSVSPPKEKKRKLENSENEKSIGEFTTSEEENNVILSQIEQMKSITLEIQNIAKKENLTKSVIKEINLIISNLKKVTSDCL